MNEIINNFLFAWDKSIPEMRWRKPGFTYSACGPFTKTKERITKFKETGDSRGLALMVYKFLDKKTSGSGIKNKNISNKRLAKELQKPIIRRFNKRKVHSSFIDKILLRFWYYVNFFTNTSKILSWKSIGLLKESIENITTSNSNFDPTLFNYYPLPDIKFNRNWLINNNDLSLDAVNLYVCYELNRYLRDLDTDFTLGNCSNDLPIDNMKKKKHD